MNTINAKWLEWDAMLNRGIIPVMEFQISENDWLIVDIEYTDKGLEFSFDSNNKPVCFDGEIVVINDNRYLLPFDEYFGLDAHLEMISNNITEGYLLPNDLYYSAE
jgi:hypothetical protein